MNVQAIADLGPLQITLMQRLWGMGEGGVHEILAGFPAAEVPGYVTALTVLRRLERRGFVSHRVERREGARPRFVYKAEVTEEQYQQAVVEDLVRRVFGSPANLIAKAQGLS